VQKIMAYGLYWLLTAAERCVTSRVQGDHRRVLRVPPASKAKHPSWIHQVNVLLHIGLTIRFFSP
jgi:hypothetical protein